MLPVIVGNTLIEAPRWPLTPLSLCLTHCYAVIVKFTLYYQEMRLRPDRRMIREEWVLHVMQHPIREVTQEDGRIRRWAPITEMDGRYLRVILLPDGETVHNAFFDRSFKPLE